MSEAQQQMNYDDMLKVGMHFGRKKTVFNPKMKKYIFTVKEGICIIDLLKTQSELNEAINFLKKVLSENGLVLFVATTKQSVDSVKDLAESLGMPYVIDRWIGGTLTNCKVISGRVKYMEDMEREQQSGGLDKYTKKEKLMLEREIKKMQVRFGGLRKLTKMPDAIFISSVKESPLPINEASKMNVKTIAIANTDANPTPVDYIIPANDRSKKSVDLIVSAIKNELTKNDK
jgi:small subunit ribosomal protein S2